MCCAQWYLWSEKAHDRFVCLLQLSQPMTDENHQNRLKIILNNQYLHLILLTQFLWNLSSTALTQSTLVFLRRSVQRKNTDWLLLQRHNPARCHGMHQTSLVHYGGWIRSGKQVLVCSPWPWPWLPYHKQIPTYRSNRMKEWSVEKHLKRQFFNWRYPQLLLHY